LERDFVCLFYFINPASVWLSFFLDSPFHLLRYIGCAVAVLLYLLGYIVFPLEDCAEPDFRIEGI
jgi:hypothetical protein